jgi:membrane protease YdiL (CAAX protease family)
VGTALGCFFGWVYFRSGSVGACILMHMVANVIGFVLRFLFDFDAPVDPQSELLDGYGAGLNQFLVGHAILVAIFVACVLLLKSEFNRTPYSPASEFQA